MHITQETDYALRIVYCLAKSGVRQDARTISEEMCVTLRFSLKILGKLVQNGVVKSYKGNRGGYELARESADITLLDVIGAVEGPYAMSRCVAEDTGGECSRGASGCCAFQNVFARLSHTVNQQLAQVNFRDIVSNEAANRAQSLSR